MFQDLIKRLDNKLRYLDVDFYALKFNNFKDYFQALHDCVIFYDKEKRKIIATGDFHFYVYDPILSTECQARLEQEIDDGVRVKAESNFRETQGYKILEEEFINKTLQDLNKID